MSLGLSVLSCKSKGLITNSDHDVEHLKTTSREQNSNIFGLAMD